MIQCKVKLEVVDISSFNDFKGSSNLLPLDTLNLLHKVYDCISILLIALFLIHGLMSGNLFLCRLLSR